MIDCEICLSLHGNSGFRNDDGVMDFMYSQTARIVEVFAS
jgi:hypothetical protein